MSFEQLGRALDELTQTMTQSMGRALHQFSRSVARLTNPHYAVEGRRLTEDLCREEYDVVERNDVRVERVDSQVHSGEAASVRYDDGSEWNDVTRYDLTEIEDYLHRWE